MTSSVRFVIGVFVLLRSISTVGPDLTRFSTISINLIISNWFDFNSLRIKSYLLLRDAKSILVLAASFDWGIESSLGTLEGDMLLKGDWAMGEFNA